MEEKAGHITEILGVSVFSRSKGEVLMVLRGWLVGRVAGDGPKLVFTPNSEMIVAAAEDKEFTEVLNQGDLNMADGAGLVLAGRLGRLIRPERNYQTISAWAPGVEVAEELVAEVVKLGGKVFLLGGGEGVAKTAVEKLQGKYPDLKAKAEMGQSQVGSKGWKDQEMVMVINEYGPDLLLVGFGQGKQERWLVANKNQLKVKVAMGVGGSFDFWSGRVRRAPVWINRLALEWLWRLFQEPWRWRRQLKLFKFWGLVIGELIKGKR